MQYGIAFTPLVPSLVLWLALAVIVAIAGLLAVGAGAWCRDPRDGAGAVAAGAGQSVIYPRGA